MALGSLIGKIFGSEKAIEGAVKGISNSLDVLVYTDEEKANDAALERQKARAMVIDWMQSTSGQALARRLIAVSITFVWLMQYIFGWVMVIGAIFVEPEVADRMRQASDLTQEHADGMTGAVMLILSFYFAAPHLDKVVGPAMERFAKGGKK
tara:strand:- start:15120 stop:15575 length:456 start_codon:yes stop_codon:yes gene_type:complete